MGFFVTQAQVSVTRPVARLTTRSAERVPARSTSESQFGGGPQTDSRREGRAREQLAHAWTVRGDDAVFIALLMTPTDP